MNPAGFHLHTRLIIPLVFCLVLIVTIVQAYLYMDISKHIDMLSDSNINLVKKLTGSNAKQFHNSLEENTKQLEIISREGLNRLEKFQIKSADDLLELSSRPIEKAFDTGDKRALRTWLRRHGKVESVDEVSVINIKGRVKFSSDKSFLNRQIRAETLKKVLESSEKYREWTDKGLDTYMVKYIKKKCIRCHVHRSWSDKIGEKAGFLYLRISTSAYKNIKNEYETLLNKQISSNNAAQTDQINKNKQYSQAVIKENNRQLNKIKELVLRIFGIALAVLLVIPSVFMIFIVKKIVTKPINQMNTVLIKSADNLFSTAKQVENSSISLSKGASKQVNALEQSSFALIEISDMTRQNREHSAHADSLMLKSQKDVDEVNAYMNALTDSMASISTTSNEVSKITQTVNEIAFQTNLLALNASIEAARVGESGAGFTVVADEVRNHAVRSSAAADEISQLIKKAITNINNGANLVEMTNSAFSSIVVNTKQIKDIVSEINAASDIQAQRIENINKSVADLDIITQQNVSNADESASTAVKLNEQAQVMRGYIKKLTALLEGKTDKKKEIDI